MSNLDDNREKWNPVERPYRVMRTFANRYGQPGRGNHYRSQIATYPTVEEARDDVSANPSGKPIIHFAENADDWCRRGKWRRIK